jgi:hypothetical protein
VGVVHAAGDDDFALAVDFLGGDPGNIGTLAVHDLGGRLGRDGAGEHAILGGEGVQQAFEQLGLGVLHRQAERAFAVEMLPVKVHSCLSAEFDSGENASGSAFQVQHVFLCKPGAQVLHGVENVRLGGDGSHARRLSGLGALGGGLRLRASLDATAMLGRHVAANAEVIASRDHVWAWTGEEPGAFAPPVVLGFLPPAALPLPVPPGLPPPWV